MRCTRLDTDFLFFLEVETSEKPARTQKKDLNVYPFGLKHKGYNNTPLAGQRDHKYGFGGKEEQNELGLEWMDFHARNYDAGFGTWLNVDPLAEGYFALSPYNFVNNSPIILIDPNGKEISFTIDRDDDGKIVRFNLHLTASLLNDSSLSAKQVEEKRQNIIDAWSSIKSDSKDVLVNFTADIRIIKNKSEARAKDHVITLVDDISKVPNSEKASEGFKVMGWAGIGENFIYLDKKSSPLTAAHEIGHSSGLMHIENSNYDTFQPGAARLNYNASKMVEVFNPNQIRDFTNTSKIWKTPYNSSDFKDNFMNQASSNSQGYLINIGQIRAIVYQFENGNVNKGRQF